MQREEFQASRPAIVAAMADAVGVDLLDFTLTDASPSTYRGRRLQQARYLDLTYSVNMPGGQNMGEVQAALSDKGAFRAAFAAAGDVIAPDALLRLKDVNTQAKLLLDVQVEGEEAAEAELSLLAVGNQDFADAGLAASLVSAVVLPPVAVEWDDGEAEVTPSPFSIAGGLQPNPGFAAGAGDEQPAKLSIQAIAGIFTASVIALLLIMAVVLYWRLRRDAAEFGRMAEETEGAAEAAPVSYDAVESISTPVHVMQVEGRQVEDSSMSHGAGVHAFK